MSKIGFRIPLTYRVILFVGLTSSWCTGLAFYYMNNWVTVEGAFGPMKHPAQQFVIMGHGAAAFVMLMCFGVLVVNHLPSAWRLRRSRYLGITLTALFSFQIITAYILYYIAGEESRALISNLHVFSGASIPIVLIGHIIRGRIQRRLAPSQPP
ncbi:MAG: hypothetical protein ACPGN6_08670 [Gammaproteobacteria bacterium]|jgi:hypothetical protein